VTVPLARHRDSPAGRHRDRAPLPALRNPLGDCWKYDGAALGTEPVHVRVKYRVSEFSLERQNVPVTRQGDRASVTTHPGRAAGATGTVEFRVDGRGQGVTNSVTQAQYMRRLLHSQLDTGARVSQ
jgi:hypothetical protein